MFKNYLLLLLLCHVIGDFYVQTDYMAHRKSKSLEWVLIHCFCYAGIMFLGALAVLSWETVLFGTAASLAHMVIDITKFSYCKKKEEMTHQREQEIFVVDQSLHLCSLSVIAYFYTIQGCSLQVWDFVDKIFYVTGISKSDLVSWLAALLMIHKPMNIGISKTLLIYKPFDKDSDRKHDRNAGRFIGTVERFIMLIFIAMGQYSAIGLVLTAKSIARYDKISKEPEFAEYYLLGTLLSTIGVVVISFIL